jgi:hypothetical protein
MYNPTAVKIVNEALIHSGQEATFDVKLKSLLILIVEASLRQGYVDGWEDCKESQDGFYKQPKVTRKQLIKFAELYKKAKKELHRRRNIRS